MSQLCHRRPLKVKQLSVAKAGEKVLSSANRGEAGWRWNSVLLLFESRRDVAGRVKSGRVTSGVRCKAGFDHKLALYWRCYSLLVCVSFSIILLRL